MRALWLLSLAVWITAAPVRAQDTASEPAQESSATAPAGQISSEPPPGAGSIVPAGSPVEAFIFYIVGGVAAACALGCVISANIVRMAICLFGTLGSVAILYFLMAANFLGAIQLIVYAGGTLIVIIFGVMLTSKSLWARYLPSKGEIVAGVTVCALLFVGLLAALRNVAWPAARTAMDGFTVEQIGTQLLTTYLVPFELASVLLLAVMIGAAYLARTERQQP